MPTFILDTDVSKADGVTTFSTMAGVLARINATHGTYFSGKGAIEVQLRASTGLPMNDVIFIDQFVPTETDKLVFKAYKTNGFPFKITDVGSTQDYLIKLLDDYVYLESDEVGALIVEADPSGTVDKVLISVGKTTAGVDKVIFDGKGSTRIGGVYSAVSGWYVKNSVIKGCNRPFFGACRGLINLDHCTIKDNVLLRQVAALTNSIVKSTTTLGGDGLGVGTNYNFYDVAQGSLLYSSSAAAGDTNSSFSVPIAGTFTSDANGVYSIPAGSSYLNKDSTGGQVGAATQVIVIVDNPPVTSDGNISVAYNSSVQIDLRSFVTDDNNSINWSSLQFTQPVNGAASIGASPYIVIVNYSGTNYSGSDGITFSVADTNGGLSNNSTVNITVQPDSGVYGAIAGNMLTRGVNTTITMTNYMTSTGVEVYVKDTTTFTEYKCDVISNTNSNIVFNAPIATVPLLSNAEVIVRPITGYV